MLHVNYQIVYGEVYGHNVDGTKWKVLIHPANALCAFIYHYVENGEKRASLWNFLADGQHIRNIMKNCGTLLGDYVDKVKLNLYHDEMKKLVAPCAKSGYKVECYYKEPKKK